MQTPKSLFIPNSPVSAAWQEALADRSFRRHLFWTLILLLITLAGLSRFLEFVERRPGITVGDPVLQCIPPVDLTWLTFGLIYLGLVAGVATLGRTPRVLLIALQSYILMVIARVAMMYALPLEAPAGLIPLNDPFVQFFGSGQTPTKDLFFSGHTSTLFLLCLTAQSRPLKALFFTCTITVALAVILQHVHYTVDVLVAPFVSYGALRVVQRLHRRSTLRIIRRDRFAARKNGAVSIVLLTLLPFSARAQGRMQEDSLFAPHLGHFQRYAVLLPADYSPSIKYPVLYLLHGLWGSEVDWGEKGHIAGHAAPYELIVVMPDAGNSRYVNSAVKPHDRFEDFIVSDLRDTVESRYSIDTTRRAVAGLSMGGYGAFMLALRHPGMYRFAGGLSSAISLPRDLADGDPGIRPEEAALLGPRDSCLSHDVVQLTRGASPSTVPYFYAAVGIQDEYLKFLPYHRVWTDSLRAKGIAYEYHELPGKHNWRFWDKEIVPMLSRMAELLPITSVDHHGQR